MTHVDVRHDEDDDDDALLQVLRRLTGELQLTLEPNERSK